jgi:hypothetical protein
MLGWGEGKHPEFFVVVEIKGFGNEKTPERKHPGFFHVGAQHLFNADQFYFKDERGVGRNG